MNNIAKIAALCSNTYNVTIKEMQGKSRVREIADARNAFILLASCLGFELKEIAQVIDKPYRKVQLALYHAMKMYYILSFRHTINKLYETALQQQLFGYRPTAPQLFCGLKTISQPNDSATRADKADGYYDSSDRKGILGFKFSKQEEKCINQAMRSAYEFMQGYGRGDAVAPIDKSHYIQNNELCFLFT